jgi:hypothetical protein
MILDIINFVAFVAVLVAAIKYLPELIGRMYK